MSPRASSTTTSPQRGASAPYARRPVGPPKSSRQQFSACGACRMRRVRCDLKDLPPSASGPHPSCSNCKERNINCIDEFADVKAVKLLRRGRRLQQVEAVYGRTGEANSTAPGTSSLRTANIPVLHSDFFKSPFWRWFVVQRPILDPTDFPTRFDSHCKGAQILGNEGGLIAMLLVTWAEAFGLNERGLPHPSSAQTESSTDSGSFAPALSGDVRTKWKNKTELYLREILELLDCHSILRRPSFDGLRVLLLLLPLMEESPDLERSAIHEAALSQVRALCIQSTLLGFEEAAVRARLFWYAYTQESIITGLRGNQFVLNEEDLGAFQRALPSPSLGAAPSGLPTPPSTSNGAQKTFMQLIRTSSAPLELAKVCRNMHTVLTGNRAIRRAEEHGLVDANGMREIWRDLDRCWEELDSMLTSSSEPSNARHLELSQYVHSWQIFIFECHNVVRETLKRFMMTSKNTSPYGDNPSRPCSSSPYMSPQQLHDGATRRCVSLLPTIIHALRVRLPKEYEDSACMVRWDAGLIRDGCFYAGYIAATHDSDVLNVPRQDAAQQGAGVHLPVEEAVAVCLEALAVMRWAYSRSEEREETIRSVWEEHKVTGLELDPSVPFYDLEYSRPISIAPASNSINLSLPNTGLSSNLLRRLTILPPQRAVQSAPNTACSTDGRGLNGWPSYTPPGTATSIATTSTGTAFSSSGGDSPIFANMPPPFKASATEDLYYQTSGADLEQFSYNVPLGGSLDSDSTATMGRYTLRHSTPSEMQHHPLGTNTPVDYMSSSNFHVTSQSILNEFQSCPQFGEHGSPYH